MADGVAPGTLPHEAPALEALLPASIAGAALTRWSVRGRCFLEMLTDGAGDGSAGLLDALVHGLEAPDDGDGLVVDDLAAAVGGAPPSFVVAAARTPGTDEAALARQLLFAAAGFRDPRYALDGVGFVEHAIAGCRVLVGTPRMLRKATGQRATPYVIERPDAVFVVVAAKRPWAEEAIAGLR